MAALELYFTDDQGGRWRVYDVAFGPPLAKPHQRKILDLGDTRARYRLFVPPDPAPMLKIHDFTKAGGDRSLSLELLARQFAGASVSPKKRRPPEPRPPGTPLGM